VSSPLRFARSSAGVGSGGALRRSASWLLENPLPGADWAELRDRASGDGDRDVLAGLYASQDLADVVA
jgi:hypothetical protein